jgi:hypothetical protein
VTVYTFGSTGGQATALAMALSMALATALSRSLAGLIYAPGRGRLRHCLISAAEPAEGGGGVGVVLVISSATSGVGVVFIISTCLGRSCSFPPHTTGTPCRTQVFESHPGAATLVPSAPRIGGPSCSIWLQPSGDYAVNPGKVRSETRGRYMQPDGDTAGPSAVDSASGGDCMVATVRFCRRWT